MNYKRRSRFFYWYFVRGFSLCLLRFVFYVMVRAYFLGWENHQPWTVCISKLFRSAIQRHLVGASSFPGSNSIPLARITSRQVVQTLLACGRRYRTTSLSNLAGLSPWLPSIRLSTSGRLLINPIKTCVACEISRSQRKNPLSGAAAYLRRFRHSSKGSYSIFFGSIGNFPLHRYYYDTLSGGSTAYDLDSVEEVEPFTGQDACVAL